MKFWKRSSSSSGSGSIDRLNEMDQYYDQYNGGQQAAGAKKKSWNPLKLRGGSKASIDEERQLFPEVHESRKDRTVRIRDFLVFSMWVRFFYLFLFCFLIGFVVPLLVDELAFDEEVVDHNVAGTCHIEVGMRSNCLPDVEEEDIREDECLSRGCCYQELGVENGAPLCHHTIPSGHMLNYTGLMDSGAYVLQVAYSDVNEATADIFPRYQNPRMQAKQMNEGHVRLSLYDEDLPPDDLEDDGAVLNDVEGVSLQIATGVNGDNRFRLKVSRDDGDDTMLFDCSYGSTILGDGMSEVTLYLPRAQVYGLAGMDLSFSATTNFSSRSLYALDPNVMHGQQHLHPGFVAMDANRNFFGVKMETESPAALEVQPGVNGTTESKPVLVLRSMGGWIKLHVFTGPTPKEVSAQMAASTERALVPPRWAMGYHVCRRTGSYLGLENTLTNMNQSGIPYDTDCVDERLSRWAFVLDDRDSVSLGPSLISALSELVTYGKRLLLSLPPQVRLDSAPYAACTSASPSCFLLANETDAEMVGTFEEADSVLPDFTRNETQQWWRQQLQQFVSTTPGLTDVLTGVTLTFNSPYLNEVDCNHTEEDFPYVPADMRRAFFDDGGVACPLATHEGDEPHYLLHNGYANRQMQITADAAVEQIAFQFSKFSTPGISALGGVVSTELEPNWTNLRRTLREALELGLAGVPMVSVSGCGVYTYAPLNTSLVVDDICLRWYMVASAMPAMHSMYGTEDNSRMPYDLAGAYRDWIRRAIEHRYRLIPYTHTVMYEAVATGSPAVRPLFYEFPEEQQIYDSADQFMVGDSLLFSPVLDPLQTSQFLAFFPYGSWYELWSGLRVEGSSSYQFIEDIPYQIPVHLRAGKIIPTLTDSGMSVEESFAVADYSLFVALDCDLQPRYTWSRIFDFFSSSPTCVATGVMRLPTDNLDPGTDPILTFSANNNPDGGSVFIGEEALDGWCDSHENEERTEVTSVVIYGLAAKPSTLTVPGESDPLEVTEDFESQVFYEADLDRLQATDLLLDFCSTTNREITWNYEDDEP